MKIKMKNRSSAKAGYTIPDLRVTREFAPGETQNIEKEEIEKLSYLPGGRVLLADYFLIDDKDLAAELCPNSLDPEYWMSENDIKELMLHGSVDQFLDCLDYAPTGVIDLIKKFAVELPLADTRKIDGLKEATGFDARLALVRVKEAATEDEHNTSSSNGRRAAAPTYGEQSSGRRTAAPNYSIDDLSDKYKVVSYDTEK
jgi:hypothetical protein